LAHSRSSELEGLGAMALSWALFALSCLGALAKFELTNPSVEAAVTLAEGVWHVGGFCFRMEPEGYVGRIIVRVQWQGRTSLENLDPVYLSGFDGREEKWGQASQDWAESSCQQKLATATSNSELVHGNDKEFAFAISLKQVHDIRDWHFAVLACGSNYEAATLKVSLEAEHGALSVFESGAYFDGSSCPVERHDWWQQATGEVAFWGMLLLGAALGACLVLAVACARRSGRKPSGQEDKSLKKAYGEEVVMGKSSADDSGIANVGPPKVPDQAMTV